MNIVYKICSWISVSFVDCLGEKRELIVESPPGYGGVGNLPSVLNQQMSELFADYQEVYERSLFLESEEE